MANPANDLWVAVDEDGETLVPALADVLIDVDVDRRTDRRRGRSGLTTPEESEEPSGWGRRAGPETFFSTYRCPSRSTSPAAAIRSGSG